MFIAVSSVSTFVFYIYYKGVGVVMSSDLFCVIQWFCHPGMSDEVNNLFYWNDVIFMSFKTQGPEVNNCKSY